MALKIQGHLFRMLRTARYFAKAEHAWNEAVRVGAADRHAAVQIAMLEHGSAVMTALGEVDKAQELDQRREALVQSAVAATAPLRQVNRGPRLAKSAPVEKPVQHRKYTRRSKAEQPEAVEPKQAATV